MTNGCARTARPLYSDCPSPASSVIKSRIAEKGRASGTPLLRGLFWWLLLS